MKRTALATALLLATGTAAAHVYDFLGTFDMYSGAARIGGSVPTGANDVTGTFTFHPELGTGVPQASTGLTTSTSPVLRLCLDGT